MNTTKYILLFTSLILVNVAFTQSIIPNFQNQTTLDDELLVRWEPRNLEEWNAGLKEGYEVKIFEGVNEDEMVLIAEESVKVSSAQLWDEKVASIQDSLLRSYYEGAKSLIYSSPEMDIGLQNAIEKEEGKPISQTADEFKMIFLTYGVSCEFEAAQMAGLSYKTTITKGKYYRIEVRPKGYEPYIFLLDNNQKKKMLLPELNAKFDNKKVTLEWNMSSYVNQFFGYDLEISDNGKIFHSVSEVPYARFLDSLSTINNFEIEVPLDKNYHQKWIRLRGVDYFGNRTKHFVEVTGYGYDEIKANPAVTFAEQTADNQAHIKWDLDDSFNRLIKSIEIHRRDSLTSEFEVAMDSLPPYTREVKIPMTKPSNYFSITLIPKDGDVVRSFPVFIMGQDTIPPDTPLNFTGEMDSLGIVRLVWNQNEESDLWGYKVFRSEFIEDEFASMHSSPILDTVFVDTINLNSLNEEIHYSILALDKRNNRSPFSQILTLQRPDTIPPTPPLIRDIDFLEDSIKVEWASSSSDDVVFHQLFRKELDEKGWLMIAEIDSVDQLNFYYDKDFQLNKVYFYTVLAKDDNDLVSELSKPLTVKTKSKKPKEAFENFTVTINEEENKSVIDWKLKNFGEIVEIEVYRGETKEGLSMYEILEPDINWLEQSVKKGEEWYFLFKPIFDDGSRAKVSEIIEIVYPE